MEDREDALSPNPSQTLDPNHLEKKHAAMLERLAGRHHARLENSLARRSAEPDSSTASFLALFDDSKRAVESRIASCRLAAPSDPTQLKPELAAIAAAIAELEKLVAENSYFLPPYEVRSSLRAVAELRQSLEILSSELVPKKKFSFRNKSVSKKERGPEIAQPERPKFTVPESPGFRSWTGEVLVKRFEGSEIGEFTISDLDSCEVRLMGSPRALFVHRLRNCRVYTGPVMASVLIDGAEHCVFVVASHQIRIHHAKSTDFYLRVRSRPIIEDSFDTRFAPYCLRYEGVDRDLESAGLHEETGNWANVDDFRWLRAVQSPNWSVLPENERIGPVHISESGVGNEEN